MKLLLATTNPGKLAELKKGFEQVEGKNSELVSLTDLSIFDKPEETEKTFKGNAFLKAKFYAEKSGLPTLADDGGIEINFLNGEPGVLSRRWPGYEASDDELISYTLRKLANVPLKERGAKLTVCLCFYDPHTSQFHFVQESVDGYVAERASPNRVNGYPYRALFVVNEFNKYYDELTEVEHAKINHRLRATNKIAKLIVTFLKHEFST